MKHLRDYHLAILVVSTVGIYAGMGYVFFSPASGMKICGISLLLFFLATIGIIKR